jgi:DNA-binding transcriptional LysR family regulator
MTITLRQIEAFRAVMKAGGFTRAAQSLAISQPAISRMMSDLEQTVGFALFMRAGRGASPTPRARLLLVEVERAFLGLSHLETAARALRDSGEGQLRLAMPPSILPAVAEQWLAPFARRHPEAAVAVEIAPAFGGLDPRALRQHDLLVTFEAFGAEGFEEIAAGEARAVGLVPAGHPLARAGRPLALADLAGEGFIAYWPDSAFRLELDRAFALAEVTCHPRHEARTTAAVCELVATLGGVSVLPVSGPDILADSRLHMLPLAPALVSPVRIFRPLGPVSPLALAFLAFAGTAGLDFGRYVPAGET